VDTHAFGEDLGVVPAMARHEIGILEYRLPRFRSGVVGLLGMPT